MIANILTREEFYPPIIVGGSAVALYSGGLYGTVDIDVVTQSDEALKQILLHEDGKFDAETEFKGNIQHLFRKARTQKPEGIPYIIFIDMNLPSTIVDLQNLDIEPEKTWEKDIDQIYANYQSKHAPLPDPFNALYFTNFAFYYYGNESVAYPWVTYIKKSDSPEHEISDISVLDCILNSITRYSVIPTDI